MCFIADELCDEELCDRVETTTLWTKGANIVQHTQIVRYEQLDDAGDKLLAIVNYGDRVDHSVLAWRKVKLMFKNDD